jgi:hypothetical protein
MSTERVEGQPPLAVGEKVVLREELAGYEPGTPGVVTRSAGESVFVRFETTGHTLSVPPELLETR